MALMICPNCGHRMSDLAERCPACGAIRPQRPMKKETPLLWILISVALLFAVALCLFLLLRSAKKSGTQEADVRSETTINQTVYNIYGPGDAGASDAGSGNGGTRTASSAAADGILPIFSAQYAYCLPPSKVATYAASNLADGNRRTAWAVNLDNPVIYACDALFGPVLTTNCKKVGKVDIVNGYTKDTESFYNNTRAAWIVIYRADNMAGDFPDKKDIIYEGRLKDTPKVQTLHVAPAFDNSRPTRKIGLIFSTKSAEGYYFGRKWNDLCISEITLYGD